MSSIITEEHSRLGPPYFDGTNYTEWKERMRLFIRYTDLKLWYTIQNGRKVPTKQTWSQQVEKSEDEYDEEEMKNLELDSKAIHILCCAMNSENFEKYSKFQTAKQIWDDLESVNSRSLPPQADTLNSSTPSDAPQVDSPPQPQVANSSTSSDAPQVDSPPQPRVPNSSTPSDAPQAHSPPQPQVPNSSTLSDALQPDTPDDCFLQNTRDAMYKFVNYCVPLHKHALEGNWTAAKSILDTNDNRLKHAAIASGWPTLLHVAAGANHPPFVKELLQVLEREPQHIRYIRLRDIKGNTAFCFAAASGNMEIVRLLKTKDPGLLNIRGAGGYTPLHFAVMQGKCDVAWFLYEDTIAQFQDRDWELLLFTCIDTGDYAMALKIAQGRGQLANARDSKGDTALHILAQIQKPLDCCCHRPEHQNPSKKQDTYLELVNFLWEKMLETNDSMDNIVDNIISEPFQLLFNAAEIGNFGFLSKLMSANPSLIWEVDNKNQSIIHTAVLHRHASIFNLVHEIGCHKDIIVKYPVKENNTKDNTLLHLAAKLAPPGQLELVSGAAFQMSLELMWFEEVKKIMPPSYVNFKNSVGLTAQQLFTKEHKELRKEAEEWMKRTAEFCIIVSTVIAAAVFSAAINIPGGVDDNTNKPNYLGKTSFLVFVISDAAAFILSAIATLIFLSILISRYAEYDFHRSLPLKLISGLVIFFISIIFMMVAFSSSFFITYYYSSMLVPSIISGIACLPVVIFLVLQYKLWWDIISSTFCCRAPFKTGKRMITF